MKFKVTMPYIGGVLSDNNYKFLNKNTRPIVTIWKKDLAKKVEELDIPEAERYDIEVYGKFTDERRPDISNLFKVIADSLKKTNYYKGLGIDDKHFRLKDIGYELGHSDPEIEITVIPMVKVADLLSINLRKEGYYDCV